MAINVLGVIMKYSKWKDEEVKKLFKYIEEGKEKNESLIKLFEGYAKLSNRKPNSVRNYYYAELCELEQNVNRRNKLAIDIGLHQKNDSKEFTKEETDELVNKILEQTNKGISVRKACLNLANGDIEKMVRYQNKFRTSIQKTKLKKMKPMPSNVVEFRDSRSLLTDSDINSLFLGLVKLVRKQASEEADKEHKIAIEKANAMLRKALVDLKEKENEILTLRNSFKILTLEKDKLNDELKSIRGKNAELTIKYSKLNSLKKFAKKYEQKTKEEVN